MTPKEKANDLLSKMWMSSSTIEDARECASIAVDEMLKMPNIGYSHNRDASQYDYWQEVKNELKLL